jgi:small subunit ribosomal protein S14
MAKESSVQKNLNRKALVKKYSCRYERLKALSKDRSLSHQERYDARKKLARLPRNANPTRIRNRCEISGRPRGYYRDFRMSRIALRELGSLGLIPGLTKSSW